MEIGIEAASYFVPKLYLSIEELANQRGIEEQKLKNGLGLNKISLLDINEDTATLAAEALLRLITDYDINPSEISRIYLGTESALDAAKPTATYSVQMVASILENKYGKRCFLNCDVVDITFACIGAVDALHNALDFVRANPTKKAVVIAADYAKYTLKSSGEYTQGAGAVALLISNTPNLISIDNYWGVATESVFDFFKPRRQYKKDTFNNLSDEFPERIELFTDEPVFDGQYSNDCFKDRIREAYQHFKKEKNTTDNLLETWKHIVFHLPYAYHGKRICTELFAIEYGLPYTSKDDIKAVSNSMAYKHFTNQKMATAQIASSEVGNLYTASIFMALLSTLQAAFNNGDEIDGNKIGFFAYGSGSKAKVFEAKINSSWKNVVKHWNLFENLNQRIAINFEQYEALHKKALKNAIQLNPKGFKLTHIELEKPTLTGARFYTYL